MVPRRDLRAKPCPRGKAFTKERAIDLVISHSVEPVENCIIDFPIVVAIKLDRFPNTSGPFIQHVTKLKDDQ